MDDKNFLESSGEWLLKNSGRALLMGKDSVSVTLGVATATGQVVGVLRHFRWKKELDLTLYMRAISLITSDICLKKLQM